MSLIKLDYKKKIKIQIDVKNYSQRCDDESIKILQQEFYKINDKYLQQSC